MNKNRKIEILANNLVTYVLENEHASFIDWFTDDGWDDYPVCKALGVKELSEELAQSIVTSSLHEGTHNLVDCVAYYTDGDHVYADAIKLAVLIKAMDVPKLSPEDIKHIIEYTND